MKCIHCFASCLVVVAFLVPSAAVAQSDPYATLKASLERTYGTKSSAWPQEEELCRLYEYDGLNILVGYKEDAALAEFSEEEITDITAFDVLPVFVSKGEPEEGVDGFLKVLQHPKAFEVLLYHGQEPIGVMDVVDKGEGYKFGGIKGRGEALALQAAAYPNGKTEETPIYLMVGTSDYVLRPDNTVAVAYTPPESLAKGVELFTMEDLSDKLHADLTYAKENPGVLGGGASAAQATVAPQGPSGMAWVLLALGCAAVLGIGVYGGVLVRRKRRAN